jgi:hypothetical protein
MGFQARLAVALTTLMNTLHHALPSTMSLRWRRGVQLVPILSAGRGSRCRGLHTGPSLRQDGIG